MKTLTKQFTIYTFNELSEIAKSKAITDYINSFLELDYEMQSDNWKKAINKSEEMQTPWFCALYVWEYDEENITIELEKELYLQDGMVVYE